MTRYSIQPRDRIFVKSYGFSFTKNLAKNTDKKISKNLSGKYSQKLIDCAKQSAIDLFETASKRAIEKTAEAAGDLIGNKVADKITKVSRISPQNKLETVTNAEENVGLDREIPRARFMSPENRQNFIDDLRLI